MPRSPQLEPHSDPRPSRRLLAAAKVFPWSLLNAEARSIVEKFVASWEKLLQDRRSTERDYHRLIAQQAAQTLAFQRGCGLWRLDPLTRLRASLSRGDGRRAVAGCAP